jgi:hypothetical protein
MISHHLHDFLYIFYILRMIFFFYFKDGLKAPKILQIDQTENNDLQDISYRQMTKLIGDKSQRTTCSYLKTLYN